MINTEHFVRTKKLLEYLESFSLANQLTNSINSEHVSFSYSAVFGSYTMKMDVRNDIAGGMKVHIQHSLILSKFSVNPKVNERRRQLHSEIRGAIGKSNSSYDRLKDVMVFIVDNLEDLNLVINMLNEGD